MRTMIYYNKMGVGTMKKYLGMLICLVLVLVQLTWGSVPNVIRLEAKLTDDQGGLISGQKDVLVEIQLGETTVWQESHENVQFTDGVFQLSLGETTAFQSHMFSDQSKGFVITVDGNEILIPITSLPSAYKAKWADSVLNFDWNQVNVTNTPNIGAFPGVLISSQIPDEIVTSAMIGVGEVTNAHLKGSISASKIVGNIQANNLGDGVILSSHIQDGTIVEADLAEGPFRNITALGTLTSTLNINAGLTMSGARFFVHENDIKVGVGTAEPKSMFHVAGDVQVNNLPAITDPGLVLTHENNVLRSIDTSAWDKDAASDVTVFSDLVDTPSNFTNAAGFFVRVNDSSEQLIFQDPTTFEFGNASRLDTLDSLQFLRSDQDDSFTVGSLSFENQTALKLDAGSRLVVANGAAIDVDAGVEMSVTGSLRLNPGSNLDIRGDVLLNGAGIQRGSVLVSNLTNDLVALNAAQNAHILIQKHTFVKKIFLTQKRQPTQ